MTKSMENDISDDDSDSPSIVELLDLVHEDQNIIKKQSKEIKNQMVLMLLLLQIVKICYANSNFLMRSMKSLN